jgi:hypothetical protein
LAHRWPPLDFQSFSFASHASGVTSSPVGLNAMVKSLSGNTIYVNGDPPALDFAEGSPATGLGLLSNVVD